MRSNLRQFAPIAFAMLMMCWLACPHGAFGQQDSIHYFHSANLPPGTVGRGQLLRGGPLPGYFQPVEVRTPQGATISLAVGGQFTEPKPDALLAGMLIGQVYRLRISNIPGQVGQEVFPTIELVNRLHPPPGQEVRFPIPVDISAEEMELALSGRFVTRVIYLEDPTNPLPLAEDRKFQRYFEVKPDQDPLRVADELGRPMAILRMGSRVPDIEHEQTNLGFSYGYPPVRFFEQPVCPPRIGIGRAACGASGRSAQAEPFSATAAKHAGRSACPQLQSPSAAMSHHFHCTFRSNMRLVRVMALVVATLPVTAACRTPNGNLGKSAGLAASANRQPANVIAAKTSGGRSTSRSNRSVIVVDPPTSPSVESLTAISRPSPALLDRGTAAVSDDRGVDVSSLKTKEDIALASYEPPSLPANATTGGPLPPGGLGGHCPPGIPEEGVEYLNPWVPDGLAGPWPYDEYIWDGGDRETPVVVDSDWTVRGLDLEDTVAHYDTRDGRRLVEPSNRVPIYAPRFAAVRKVYGLEIHEAHERMAGVENPVRLTSQEATRVATTAIQPVQPVLQHGLKTPVNFRERTQGIVVDNTQRIVGLENAFLPHEDLLLIRRGEFDTSEKARLAERTQAAIVWASHLMPQIMIEGRPASEAINYSNAQETTVYELPPGKSRLRICKIASKSEAQPGEEIDFTIRFDNVGDQRIGNVTIIDSLTTRLEYVPDSAESTLKANFATQENNGDSLVLRWEIIDPLEVGQGGIVRFKCKLR